MLPGKILLRGSPSSLSNQIEYQYEQVRFQDYFKDGGRRLFEAGVNATITGDMLTTVGNNTKQDQEMLTDMGFQI